MNDLREFGRSREGLLIWKELLNEEKKKRKKIRRPESHCHMLVSVPNRKEKDSSLHLKRKESQIRSEVLVNSVTNVDINNNRQKGRLSEVSFPK